MGEMSLHSEISLYSLSQYEGLDGIPVKIYGVCSYLNSIVMAFVV